MTLRFDKTLGLEHKMKFDNVKGLVLTTRGRDKSVSILEKTPLLYWYRIGFFIISFYKEKRMRIVKLSQQVELYSSYAWKDIHILVHDIVSPLTTRQETQRRISTANFVVKYNERPKLDIWNLLVLRNCSTTSIPVLFHKQRIRHHGWIMLMLMLCTYTIVELLKYLVTKFAWTKSRKWQWISSLRKERTKKQFIDRWVDQGVARNYTYSIHS